MKLLSIIIPLYNSAPWVEKCLDSVLKQDIPAEQMEIICINDGSPDNSADIVRTKSEEVRDKNGYSPIVLLDQENQGPSGARNNGMRHATGKYLMFVDPDDYVEPNTFGGLIEQMEREQLDMLRFDFQMVDEYDTIIPKILDEQLFDSTPQLMTGAEFLATRLRAGCNIWRYVYRTEIITKNNIWCFTGDYFDDTPWLPLVLLKAERMNICNVVVYDYMERTDGLVRAISDKAISRKIDGHFYLQNLLLKERDDVQNMEMAVTTKSGIDEWFGNMISHSVLTLLTLIALYRFEQRKDWLNKINPAVYPLTTSRSIAKSERKVKWINRSPMLFVWMIHLKNFF